MKTAFSFCLNKRIEATAMNLGQTNVLNQVLIFFG